MAKMLFGFAAAALTLAACSQSPSQVEADAATAQSAGTDTGGAPYASVPAGSDQTILAQPGTTSTAPTMTPQEYVAAAVASDQFEIQSSQLALQRTKNEAVTRFAKMMVADHRASTGAMTKAAGQAALTAPRFELTPRHQALLDDLRAAGDTGDQVYLDQQRAAHAEAIAMHRSAATTANVPEPLAALAKDMLPRVEGHAKMLAGITIGKTGG